MLDSQIYKDIKAPAAALGVIAIRKYGTDVIHLDPVLLQHDIERDFNLELPPIQLDKLQACFTVMASESYENDWRAFEMINHAFNGQDTDKEDIVPLEAEEIASGLADFITIKTSVLDADEQITYGEEVKAYAGTVFYDYGFCKAPTIFPVAILKECSTDNCCYKDKDEALHEIYSDRLSQIVDYLEKV